MVANQLIVRALPVLPRGFVSRFAMRYVAGATLDDALAVMRELERRGRSATIDVLGEEHETRHHVEHLVAEYRRVLELSEHPSATLSVRMTALGLRLDEGLSWENLRALAVEAGERGRDLTIDMEDSSTVDQTLDAYRRLRGDGLDHAGIVLQAYLRRTLADVRELAPLQPRVRVVKGIWVEPYAVAYQDFETIRRNYVHTLERVLDCGSYVEIATHDEWLVAEALSLVDRFGRAPDEVEFQMLLGVKDELGDVLVRDGHQVRVYVPYGEHWWEYCLRRLRENPQVARYVIEDSLKTMTGRSPGPSRPAVAGRA